MKFSPTAAGALYGFLCGILPAVAIVLTASGAEVHAKFGVTLAMLLAVLAAAAVASGISFSFGARIAPQRHSLKSILFACVVTWSFSRATNHFAEAPSLTSPAWLVLVLAFNLAFSFIAGWRFAIPAKAQLSKDGIPKDFVQPAKAYFPRARMTEGVHRRLKIMAALPEGCLVGSIHKSVPNSDPWFYVYFPSTMEHQVRTVLDGASDLLNVSFPNDKGDRDQ